MVFKHQVKVSTTINAPPALVRQTFLDFESLPQWSQAFIKHIKVTDTANVASPLPAGHANDGPAVGTKLEVKLPDMTFKPNVVTNTTTEFAWLGRVLLPSLFDGKHYFRFEPTEDGQGTLFTHGEDFNGALVGLLSVTSLGTQLPINFKAFNEDLKREAEARAARKP